MSGGYAYTTLSAAPGEPVEVAVALYLDDRAWIVTCGAGKARPHLAVRFGDVAVSFSPASPGNVTPDDARIARRLADQAATYAAEIERLAAAGGPGGAAA
jgi:hypothetical protein